MLEKILTPAVKTALKVFLLALAGALIEALSGVLDALIVP